ncbi:caffeine-induced death protein 2 [Syncephalis fuscata]|nr:caffeine-induced death protein 2 [Syncephalis fuscata]
MSSGMHVDNEPAPAPENCYNLSYFKEYMKELRRIDDNIMLRMNTTNTYSEASCADFFHQLATAYQRRERAVTYCQNILDEKLDKTRQELTDDPDDVRVKSRLFAEETQRRLVTNELIVEDIVRSRSMKVFRDRCRAFRVPNDFEDFLAHRFK